MGQETSCRTLDGTSDFSDALLRSLLEASTPLPLPRPGALLGGQQGRRFELHEQLGRGGMGQVFRAWDSVLRRHVALKFMQPLEEVSGPLLSSLLEQEARAIARLDHDNIIRIFDVSEWRAGPSAVVPFLVMELLKGQSLSTCLRRGALEWHEAVALFRDVLAGLAHAHAHEVIHRDLKPGNVFVLEGGRAKLLDFGLARLAAGPDSAATRGLHPVGSPAYMAPEQWREAPHDARTDLWAAGLLFYLLLTGQHPCPGGSMRAMRDWALSPRPLPSVRARRPELPAEVDLLLGKATAPEPAHRFQSVHELACQLEALEQRREAARTAPAEPRRAQVTFVCCLMARPDEPLDEEALGELQAAFQQACSEHLLRQDGTVLQCMGDEVLGCLGHPRSDEDALPRAVRAGLELATMPRARFSVRVGLHTASVVLSPLAARHSGASAAIQGDAHLLAVRAARQAEAGAVLLSQSTFQGLRGAFVTEPLASQPGPVALHRLLRERQEPLRFERMSPPGLSPLVGRSEELRQLREHWARAREGHGALLLLQGEAGIGKSRLLRELRAQVGPEAGCQVAAQCWQESSTSPLFPFSQLLRQLFALPAEASPEQWRRRVRQTLEALGGSREELLPLLESLLCLPGAEAPCPEGAQRRQAQFLELLVSLLLELTGARDAAARPALLIIEDLHWADPSTLDLLRYLLARTRSARLCVLLTARPELQLPLATASGFHRLVLPRLSVEHTTALVAEVTRGQHLSEDKLRHLREKTDGNPLFIEEMARMFLSEAATARGHANAPAIPIPLQALLQARLDSLPREQRDLARRCAILGGGFSPSLLAACVEEPAEALRPGLEALVAAGLLRRNDAAREARYEFRHALLQEQARESLPPPERRRVHQRIAWHLAEHVAEPSGFPPEWVAHHFTQAREWAQAHHWWKEAGRLAMGHRAYTEAVHHYQQARNALAQLPSGTARVAEELRLLLEMGVPMLLTRSTQDEVKDLFLHARELCHQTGEADLLPPALSGLFFWHVQRAHYAAALDMAKALVDVGERTGSPEVQGVGSLWLGDCLFLQGRFRPALDHFERARELLGPEFDLERERALSKVYCYSPRVLACVIPALARLLLDGPCPEAVSNCEQALRHLETLRCPMTESLALVYASVFFQQCGDLERAHALSAKLTPLTVHYNLSSCVGVAEALHVWGLEKRGKAGGLRACIQKWADAGMRKGMPYCFVLLADLHLGCGELESGLEAVDEALGWVEALDERSVEAELHHLKGQLLWRRGDEDAARASLHRALEVARHQESRFFERRAMETLELLHLPRNHSE
ncbi:protein kinase domain-containing protein [Pyxidicoccus xibeiensis]|uniref:protein kinase domain-containing protein n=1 Tax=Pyxidicoccus xibeiensis TaxID=2906759 RepID=UPI0020A76175|nr:AAA family ATPase [Pyxidicoccus xibeiensis]MCP3140172.1 AAA family ATPase [Pyxidicoccus xibeiensis]